MSAQPCGCDKEAAWMCKRHLEEALSLRNAAPAKQVDSAWRAAETVYAETGSVAGALDRFRQRLSDERAMRDTTDASKPLADAYQRTWPVPIDTPAVRIVTAVADLVAERQRIAAVLAAFYRAELSLSSVQPVLALALELNPELVERSR